MSLDMCCLMKSNFHSKIKNTHLLKIQNKHKPEAFLMNLYPYILCKTHHQWITSSQTETLSFYPIKPCQVAILLAQTLVLTHPSGTETTLCLSQPFLINLVACHRCPKLSSIDDSQQRQSEVSSIVSSNIHALTSIHPMQTCSKDGIHKPKQYFNLSATKHVMLANIQPITYKQALHQPHWKHAIDEEYTGLESNRTWTLVPLPPD